MQVIFNKGKYAVNHVFEHGVRFKMTELAPAAILMLTVKNRVDNLHVKSRGVGFLAQFIVIEDFDKHQIRNLFNHRKGIGHAGRPEYIPNAVNFVFQFASNHIYSLLCVIDLKKIVGSVAPLFIIVKSWAFFKAMRGIITKEAFRPFLAPSVLFASLPVHSANVQLPAPLHPQPAPALSDCPPFPPHPQPKPVHPKRAAVRQE